MSEVAEFFGVSPTVVQRDWQHQGMPGSRGAYPLDEIVRWRVDRLRESASIPADDELAKRAEAAEVLTKEVNLRQRELNYQKAAGEVINKAEALSEIEQVFHEVRARLEQIPQEMGSSVPPELRADAIADWKHKIHLVLRQMEGWSLE